MTAKPINILSKNPYPAPAVTTTISHWAVVSLDNYAALFIKDVDLQQQQLTYKVVSPKGESLEPAQRSAFHLEGELVQLATCSLPWTEFQRVIEILHP